jgi:hypothetical protein
MLQYNTGDARRRGPEERDVWRARDEVAGQLATRDVSVRADDEPEALVRVLEAVEAFERAVVDAGGDLMNNQLRSNDPDNPAFVLPRRAEDEAAAAYERRVREATTRIVRVD